MNTPEFRLLDIWQFVVEQKRVKPKMQAYSNIAEKVGISERNVRENIRKLVDLGYLVIKNDWYATNLDCEFIRYVINDYMRNVTATATASHYSIAQDLADQVQCEQSDKKMFNLRKPLPAKRKGIGMPSIGSLISDSFDFLSEKLRSTKNNASCSKAFHLSVDEVQVENDSNMDRFLQSVSDDVDSAIIAILRLKGFDLPLEVIHDV
jgi:hypothetical protein